MQIIKRIIVPSITVLFTIAAVVLNSSINITALIMACILFAASTMFERKGEFTPYLQLALLILFHYISQMNWCMLLYCILTILNIENRPKYSQGVVYTVVCILSFSIMRFTYSDMTSYELLVTLMSIFPFTLIVLLFYYVKSLEKEKKMLSSQNSFLSRHDTITGLLNYDGYMKSIQDFVECKEPFALVLIDLQDFKSINHESMENGNEILARIAVVLREYFPKAKAMSRYAGDRFALMLPPADNLQQQLSSMVNAKALGFQITYCMSHFPAEAETSQELIASAEEKLFQNRRSLWFKREENMFRTEKLKVVGELAAGMAHEIRNPLTTIKGFMQIAVHHDYNVKPWFNTIMSEITRMNELTAEFLQFSKPHISNMKPEPLGQLIDRLLYLIESEAAFRGHRIHYNPSNTCTFIQMDRDKIVQVLLNLVRNAFEAMEESGDVYIRILLNADSAMIEIEDTGSGISDQELDTIFDPFYTTKENGTGLGLSICQKIAQDHGGTLVVTSKLGMGSTFRLRLPLDPAIAFTATQAPELEH